MKRIRVLTAGGDTPALNATIKGAVVRANKPTARSVPSGGGCSEPS